MLTASVIRIYCFQQIRRENMKISTGAFRQKIDRVQDDERSLVPFDQRRNGFGPLSQSLFECSLLEFDLCQKFIRYAFSLLPQVGCALPDKSGKADNGRRQDGGTRGKLLDGLEHGKFRTLNDRDNGACHDSPSCDDKAHSFSMWITESSCQPMFGRFFGGRS